MAPLRQNHFRHDLAGRTPRSKDGAIMRLPRFARRFVEESASPGAKHVGSACHAAEFRHRGISPDMAQLTILQTEGNVAELVKYLLKLPNRQRLKRPANLTAHDVEPTIKLDDSFGAHFEWNKRYSDYELIMRGRQNALVPRHSPFGID